MDKPKHITNSSMNANWKIPGPSSLLVPNFRDVGKTINDLSGKTLLRETVLFRGGEVDFVKDLTPIQSPKSIINLRKGSDPNFQDATVYHCPAPDSVDVYSVASGFNRKWIISVLTILASADAQAPFFIHCAAGKDRTGVIIGAILSLLNIDSEHIQEDYALSDGPIYPKLFAESLFQFTQNNYFRKLNLQKIHERFTL
ncbi:MAG: tyrosine-protein phosphatase [Verrucomicrobiota bacterium]